MFWFLIELLNGVADGFGVSNRFDFIRVIDAEVEVVIGTRRQFDDVHVVNSFVLRRFKIAEAKVYAGQAEFVLIEDEFARFRIFEAIGGIGVQYGIEFEVE